MANNHIPEFVVIGLGRFGGSVARDLARRGASVLGIDRDIDIARRHAEDLTDVAMLDSTDEASLRSVDIGAYKTAVVAMGSNFEANLITVSILKQFGVPVIIAKALTSRQRDILLRMGATRVILPEQEAGEMLSRTLMHPNLIDELRLGDTHALADMRLPAAWAGQTLQQLNVRAEHGVSVLVVRRGSAVTVAPDAAFRLEAGDVITVAGPHKQVDAVTSG
jgi:trk system potassium uptake protein